jgi:hypothetical protein
VTNLEHDLNKTIPNTYKILKHANRDVKGMANIKVGIKENI